MQLVVLLDALHVTAAFQSSHTLRMLRKGERSCLDLGSLFLLLSSHSSDSAAPLKPPLPSTALCGSPFHNFTLHLIQLRSA